MEDSIIKQIARVKHKKLPIIRFASIFALVSFSFTAQAGKITSIPSASGAEGFGGWNLDNVEVVLNGTQGVYFRDYSNSVYPCIIIHSAYNTMVFAGLILHGNMNFPSL